MNFSNVFILTYGRSGSTLLQGLLNSIDNSLIRGENYNFCYGLYLSYESLVKTKKEFGKGDDSLKTTCPWYGASNFDEERFLRDAKNLILNQLNPGGHEKSCIGFKEIRYISITDQKKLHDYLRFLELLFTNSAFIILTREHHEVAKSGWWKTKDSNLTISQLVKFEKSIFSYFQEKNNYFHIEYKDMITHGDKIKKLFDFLGANYDAKKIEQILKTEHSYKTKEEIKTITSNSIVEKKSLPLVEWASLDKIDLTNLTNFSLSGVVVLNSSYTPNIDFNLFVKIDSKKYKIDWFLPSPIISKKYPNNPLAKKARFKISSLNIQNKSEINVYVCDNNKKEFLIFTINLT